ncbi:MAG: putative signal transducing protein [Planctomycetaceae bacterium]
MSHDPDSLEVLASVPTEAEAAMIVAALDERGLRAQAVGGHTAGFRADAPGEVAVLVRRMDLDAAARILQELRGKNA